MILGLNVGSGKDYREGYTNIEPNTDKFKSDLPIKIQDVHFDTFKKDTIDEILCQDVIDHMMPTEAKTQLKKFYYWLKPNGILNIHTPNLEFIGSEASKGNHEALKWLYGTDGIGSTNYETNIIRWCYSRKSLQDMLESIGFIVIKTELTCLNYGFRMLATKR